jgi:hypothetical protein
MIAHRAGWNLAPLLLCLAGVPATAADVEASPPLPPSLDGRTFDVFLDDREVGRHTFRFDGTPDDFTLRSEAEIRVKIAFVTVFRYEHEATERWVDGCMTRLDSQTDDNGDDIAVTGVARETGFSVESGDGGETWDVDCAWGFAYWNPALPGRERLINPQDGNLLEIAWEDLGGRRITVDGIEIAARAWSLKAEEMDIRLYYDDADRWVGLDSRRDGRLVRYRPAESDPAHPG